VIYLEEAASMNKNVVFRVVIPLLEVVGTALIAISTPLKKANFYSELCELKDHEGGKVFNVIQITMACEKCEQIKRKATDKPRVCKHVLNRLPPWKDAEKHELVKLIYEQVGRSGDYDRESRGMIKDDGDAAFQPEWIDAFERRAPYRNTHAPRWILTTCDPNGGGSSSDTAIVSAYFHKGKMVICGIDFHDTKRNEKKLLLRAHIKALRKVDRFRNSWIIFVPENNLDDAARALVNEARKMERVHVYTDENLMEGAKTKPWTKIQYTERAVEYLADVDSRVFFDRDLVCANPFKPMDQRLSALKPEFIRQLRQWRKLVYAEKTARTAPYITCSGKTDDMGMIVPGQKDDLAMAFVMNAYFSHIVHRDRTRFPADLYQ
jgi:hypothetical protein